MTFDIEQYIVEQVEILTEWWKTTGIDWTDCCDHRDQTVMDNTNGRIEQLADLAKTIGKPELVKQPEIICNYNPDGSRMG